MTAQNRLRAPIFSARIVVLAFLALLSGERSLAANAPVEMFYRSFAYPKVVLSPSGKYFAALYPANGTTNLAVIDVATNAGHPLTAFSAPTEVTDVGWDTEDRLIYGFDSIHRIGVRTHSLAAVDRDGKNPLMLVDNAGSGIKRFESVDLVDWTPTDSHSVLISSDMETPDFPAVYRMSTSSGWHGMDTPSTKSRNVFPTIRVRVVPAPGRKCSYLADNSGAVRLCTTTETDGSSRLLYRTDAKSEWAQITGFRDSTRVVHAIGFTPDDRSLYVLSNRDRDTVALFEMDPASGKLGKLVYAAPDGVDIASAVWSSDYKTLLGVNYHTSEWHTHYFDARSAALQKDLREVFPDYSIQVINFSQDGSKAIVLVANEKLPGGYYFYDSAAKQVTSLAPLAPWLDPKELSPLQSIQYVSRDGVKIDGYLTVPRDKAPKKLPLIAYPHGGPVMRDTETWNPDAQFFANRGYAVLQMNFRGSAGSGTQFREAGNREWGGKMLDDIYDAIRWAVDQGIADPKRICIFGASYGGYAALMTAAKHPDEFRCAISYAGVTDLESLYQPPTDRQGWRVERSSEQLSWLNRTLGDARDTQFLRANSPVSNAAAIACPVFIAHGRQDFNVPFANAVQMRDALLKARKTVEFLEKPDEGHGFRNEAHRIELFTRIDTFLKKYNPAE